MLQGNIDIEKLDAYCRGLLSPEETALLDVRKQHDAEFSDEVDRHILFINSLKQVGDREILTEIFDEAHATIENTPAKKQTLIGKYWPMVSIAASVAIISVLGTLFMTSSIEEKQTANYKELRRNLDQIRRSQSLIMEDIEKSKAKPKPLAHYAGSGFMISSNGYLVTSYHVVKGADSIYVENATFGSIPAHTIYSDKENDISILKIDSTFKHLPYTISKSETQLAEQVYTLGYPREDVVFGEGSVSALSGYLQNPNAYQISIPVNPGNSGGPLLNSKGDLIGIISGIQTETLGAAFAIKSTVLLSVVQEVVKDSIATDVTLPKNNTIKNYPRVQQVQQWKDYVFMVRVYKNKD
jgi:serine protease Do